MLFNAAWHSAKDATIKNFAFAPAASSAVETAGVPAGASVSIPIGTTVEEATKRLVQATIELRKGNKLKAARMLGIPPLHHVPTFLGSGAMIAFGAAAKWQ